MASRALSGKGAHVSSGSVFSGLDAKTAGERPAGLRHSLFELLSHVVFWQGWVVKWCDAEKPRVPKHASGSWPSKAAPENEAEWAASVRRFQQGLKALERRSREADLLAKGGKQSGLANAARDCIAQWLSHR